MSTAVASLPCPILLYAIFLHGPSAFAAYFLLLWMVSRGYSKIALDILLYLIIGDIVIKSMMEMGFFPTHFVMFDLTVYY